VVHSPHWHLEIFKKIEIQDAKGARDLFGEHLKAMVPILIELEGTKVASDGESNAKSERIWPKINRDIRL
jgi:hypothetical protein